MSNVASLREIRRRIRSVENTKKITRAMEMVAAAKLRRFQDFLESVRPYTEKLEALLAELLERLPASYAHPFFGGAAEGKARPARLLVVFTSDTGLCGTHNSTIEEKTRAWFREHQEGKPSFVFVGKHGAAALQKKVGEVRMVLSDLRVSRIEEILSELAKALKEAFGKETVMEIDALYTHMESLTRYEPVTKRLLPIAFGTAFGTISWGDRFSETKRPKPVPPGNGTEILIEPDLKTVLDRLIPAVFEARLRYIFYHALLTEQIARMSAMRQATQNAEEMIDNLTLARNKARQASITKELIEIVSGSRALKLK